MSSVFMIPLTVFNFISMYLYFSWYYTDSFWYFKASSCIFSQFSDFISPSGFIHPFYYYSAFGSFILCCLAPEWDGEWPYFFVGLGLGSFPGLFWGDTMSLWYFPRIFSGSYSFKYSSVQFFSNYFRSQCIKSMFSWTLPFANFSISIRLSILTLSRAAWIIFILAINS